MRRLQSSPWASFAAGALTILALAAILSVAGVVLADPPTPEAESPEATVGRYLHIQGRLTDAAGVPINGSRYLTMTLYSAPTGGTIVCQDTSDSTTVSNGLFEFLMDYCDANELNGQGLWLAVQVGGLPEMSPRQQILPVPYAYTVVPGANIGGPGSSDGSLYFYESDGSASIALTSPAGGDIGLYNASGSRTIFFDGSTGNISQARTGYGLAKAGVYANCGAPASGITRYFNAAGAAVTIASGGYVGYCVIDFGFQVDDRFLVATALDQAGAGVSCVYSAADNQDLLCYRYYAATGVGENGPIMVLIY